MTDLAREQHAIETGARLERDAIIAWLRGRVSRWQHPSDHYVDWSDQMAHMIEADAHHDWEHHA